MAAVKGAAPLLGRVVLAHSGLRLFDDGDTIPLRLISSQAFRTGVPNVVYRLAQSEQ